MERGRGARELALSISNILIKAERVPPEHVLAHPSESTRHELAWIVEEVRMG